MEDRSAQPVIHLESVRFAWRGSTPFSLSIDALSIMAGEHLFVSGPSGSGKTTLLGLLSGVLDPQSGQVSVLGQPLGRLRAAQRDAFRAAHMGVVFQLFNLVPYLPVLDNVLLPCRFSNERRARVTANGGDLRDAARRLLGRLGLDASLYRRPVTELSVGQQQRVAVARALLGAPGLVLADEPTSALDAAARDEFIELLFEESRLAGSTVVYVSHDQAIAQHFTRRIEMRDLVDGQIADAQTSRAAD